MFQITICCDCALCKEKYFETQMFSDVNGQIRYLNIILHADDISLNYNLQNVILNSMFHATNVRTKQYTDFKVKCAKLTPTFHFHFGINSTTFNTYLIGL